MATRSAPIPAFFRRRVACGLAALFLALAGCQTPPMKTPVSALARGDYAAARLAVADEVVDDASDRRYLLDRMRLGVLTLADGYPEAARNVFEEVYEVLRAQGINRDRTVQSVVLNEDVKIWKGEPFEQALAFAYYAMTMAELGEWDNARAAADNALFHLRDFGTDEDGQPLDTAEIARRSLVYERAIAAGATPEQAMARVDGVGDAEGAGGDYLDHGYVAVESTFTLGYLLAGIANQQLGRDDEANDHFTRVVQVDPSLDPLVGVLRRGSYNTVLVVSWGLGPRKEGYGPDNALARFSARFLSDPAALRVQVADVGWVAYDQVLDVNAMAASHMWNNLADVRQAKSTIGTGLLYGGLAATAIGADAHSEAAVYAGLGAMAAGAFLKAGAHVDTRYADVFPQRFYVVPLNLPPAPTTVHLQVEGRPASRLVLAGLRAPEDEQAQLRYVRLVSPPAGLTSVPPAWAVSGEILYGNPFTGVASPPPLPYIVGGDDARPPSERVLDQYQRAGYLRGLTLADLRELYRLEGVAWTVEDQGGSVGVHLLEGGRSLVSPLVGTTGFARVFGQPHPPYQPRSAEVAELTERIATQPPPRVAERSDPPEPSP